MKFYKMHGLGNDYAYFDCISEKLDVNKIISKTVKLSDRHFGIGSDGAILLLPSDKADIRMRMFNSFDGSEAEMCGNGLRCTSRLAYKLGIVGKKFKVETIPGIFEVEIIEDALNSVKIKMAFPPKVNAEMEEVKSADRGFNFYRVSVGNPHAVIHINDAVKDFDVEKYGKPVENNLGLFPERTNTEFYEVEAEDILNMRVWERGSGETLACGTGACATAAAYRHSIGNSINKVTVKMRGGPLTLMWEGGDFYMQGGTSFVYTGEIDLDTL